MKTNRSKSIDSFFVDIAKKVGKKILYYKKNNLIKIEKKQNNLKTNIDITANKIWVSEIKKKFFDIDILSEELRIKPKIKNDWNGFIIDPIDGTKSLYSGHISYVTQGAYVKRGEIISSIIYNPETQENFINSSKYLKKSNNLNSIIDNYPKPNSSLIKIIKRLEIPNYIEAGSIGYKISKVLDGTSDLFIKLNTIKIWDVAPGLFLIKQNGGIITDKYFREISFNKLDIKGLIVTMNKKNLTFIKKKYPKGLVSL